MMGIYVGLSGPKSGNVEKVLVFKCFFEGSRGPRAGQSREKVYEPECFLLEK